MTETIKEISNVFTWLHPLPVTVWGVVTSLSYHDQVEEERA